jgi:hypothetical protein
LRIAGWSDTLICRTIEANEGEPMRQFLGVVALLIMALGPAVCHSQDRVPELGMARGRTILFVDDHGVLYRSGTKRVLQPLKRHSENALIDLARPWEVGIGYTSVYRDPRSGKYQLWYQAYAGARAGDRRLKCVVCYAESRDGIHFHRPELDLFPYKGQKSNIVLVSNGGYGDRYCCSVLVDASEKDPARRYKMAYYDWSVVGQREEPGLHVAFSPDGIHWTKHDQGPLLRSLFGRTAVLPFAGEEPYHEVPVKGKPPRKTWSYPLTMSDVIDVFWDPVRQVYVIIDKLWIDGPDGGTAGRMALGRTESRDFVTWSKPQLVLAPDDEDGADVEFHGAPAFFHKGRYFALCQVKSRRARLTMDLELMTSRDGLRWERPFRKEFFLARSKPGLFDSRTLLSNSTPVVLEDEIRFYYGAANVAPLDGVKSEPAQRSGVGMASIPLDRFAGLRPVAKSEPSTPPRPLENIGQVTLKPLDLKGCTEIAVNADCGDGSLRVELLNEEGYRVRGYSKDESVLIQGNSLCHRIAWKNHGLESLPAGRYMLRFHLQGATLFAVSFK